MKGTHAPYRIYRRKTKRTRAGRPVYIYYWAKWDPDSRRYDGARSTGQTTRADAETFVTARLASEKASRETVGAFARC